MVREINQALRKRIPPSWVNLTTNSSGYIWLKSEKCPKITNSYIKSNIFAQSSLVIGPNMIWKSQTKPKTNILLTPLLNAFWKYSVPPAVVLLANRIALHELFTKKNTASLAVRKSWRIDLGLNYLRNTYFECRIKQFMSYVLLLC